MKMMTAKKTTRLFLVILICGSSILSISGQTAHKNRRDADKSYTQGLYNDAEEHYRKSLEDDPEMKAFFNLGNSLYQQQRFEEARDQYDRAIARTEDPIILGKAYYNKGNSYFGEQKLGESVQAYKQALRYNPDDKDALQNLVLTKKLIREQQQQQQQQNQDQNQDENKEDQQDPQQQDQQQQNQAEDQEKSDEDKSREENPENESQMGQDSTLQDSLKQQNITREELLKLLKAIEDEDKKIQQKLRRGSVKNKKQEKDW